MRDWILGLEKAAVSRKPGVGDFDWGEVGAELERAVPDELRDLYKVINGATFNNGVRLHPLRGMGVSPTVLDESRIHPGYWAFGEAAEFPLFAVQREVVQDVHPDADLPEWVSALPSDQWLYGTHRSGQLKFYRSLEQLLGVLVPPAQTEEFGDITYARAMSAVQGALSELGTQANGVPEKAARPKTARPKPSNPVRKPVQAKRPAKKAAPAKKATAKSAPKKVAAKKTKAPVKKATKRTQGKKRR
jgi:hypothetical protein